MAFINPVKQSSDCAQVPQAGAPVGTKIYRSSTVAKVALYSTLILFIGAMCLSALLIGGCTPVIPLIAAISVIDALLIFSIIVFVKHRDDFSSITKFIPKEGENAKEIKRCRFYHKKEKNGGLRSFGCIMKYNLKEEGNGESTFNNDKNRAFYFYHEKGKKPELLAYPGDKKDNPECYRKLEEKLKEISETNPHGIHHDLEYLQSNLMQGILGTAENKASLYLMERFGGRYAKAKEDSPLMYVLSYDSTPGKEGYYCYASITHRIFSSVADYEEDRSCGELETKVRIELKTGEVTTSYNIRYPEQFKQLFAEKQEPSSDS